MSDLIGTLTAVVVGWLLSCLTQSFSYDALSRQTCSDILLELNEKLQSLSKQLENTSRGTVDDHKSILEIEKCINKLRAASFGLIIKSKQLTTAVSSSIECFLRYHKKPHGTRSQPHHIAVDFCHIWGFGLHPFAPSTQLVKILEFLQSPIYKRIQDTYFFNMRSG